MVKSISLFLMLLVSTLTFAQSGSISGKVKDQKTGEILPFVNVVIQKSTTGISTNELGIFLFSNLQTGYCTLEISCLGYKTKVISEIEIFNHKPIILEVNLEPSEKHLNEIVIKANPFIKPTESPNSLRSLGITEIKRAPGSGQDISRVIQTLPGVATTPASNRNDIIVRGGGPTENQFFVDDFEVNSINHFTTQGASGGVWGIIDANQLRNFNLSTSAFPIYADNALSSVFNLDLKKGSTEKFESQINIGTLQRGINFNGHIGNKVTFLTGVRQANFDLLFTNRPIIPKFTDAIAKVEIAVLPKSTLSILALAAFDNLNYNTNVELNDENLYALERVRKIDQTTYAIGTKWTQQWKNGNSKLIYSYNSLKNDITKHLNNDENKQKILDYSSAETSHRIELRNIFYLGKIKFTNGLLFKNQNYEVSNQSFQVSNIGIVPVNFSNLLSIHQYGFYASVNRAFFDTKLETSFGIRMNGNNYSEAFSNPIKQVSPRISLAYSVTDALKINGSIGQYYQMPSLTSLGFIGNNQLANKNTLKPIQNRHFVLGTEYHTKFNSSISIEGFYKKYKNYPLSVNDQISLANLSAGFGVFGDEALLATSEGRSYGLEFFYQQKLFKDFYGMLSYTWVNSAFTNGNSNYIASSWDYKLILSATIGKRFKGNWEVGAKWVYYGGIPYTPYDEATSALISNWDIKNQGILDYSKLNTLKTNTYHQLDIRIDKKFFYKKWSLNIFADIQNVYDFIGGIKPNLILDRDANFLPQINPSNSNSYLIKYAKKQGFGRRPNIGFIIEF